MPGRESPTAASTERAVPIKAVIFDIGRVIVRVNLNRLAEPLAAMVPSGAGAHASE